MHFNFLPYLQILTPVIVGALGALIHTAIKTPNDAQRAISLSKIAEGIAAIVVIQNPGASWATLVQSIVDQLKIAPNITTSSNVSVLTRAASAALLSIGVKPTTMTK